MNFDQIRSVLDAEIPDTKKLNDEVGLFFFRVGNTKNISTALAEVVSEKLLQDPTAKDNLVEILANTQAVSVPVCSFFITQAQKQFPEGTNVLEGTVAKFLTDYISNYSAAELAEGVLPEPTQAPKADSATLTDGTDASKALADTEAKVMPKAEINPLNAQITAFVYASNAFEAHGVPKDEAWSLASSLNLSIPEPTPNLNLEMECVAELVDSVLDKRARLHFGLREPSEIGQPRHFGMGDANDPEKVQAAKDKATLTKFASELPSVKELAAEKKTLDSTMAPHLFMAEEAEETEGSAISV